MNFQGKTILLGVGGGIAAYKACDLASKLTQAGARVRVVMTASAQRFVAPLTFQALTLQPVHTSLWPESSDSASGVEAAMAHISLAVEADAVLIAPASADLIARLAQGSADDLLTTLVLATRAPVLVSPAMNPTMLSHPATVRNMETLRGLGYRLIEPDEGRMACEHIGKGRLPSTDALMSELHSLWRPRDMEGVRVLVTAGPTREAIDPVRYISNRSSGRMGYALAEEAAARGAHVTLVSGPTNLPLPPGVERVDVTTTQQMFEAATSLSPDFDIVVAAAAPADFRVEAAMAHKIKKQGDEPMSLQLVPNPDIIRAVASGRKSNQKIIGFAAETQNVRQEARRKLREKGLDAVVANDVSGEDSGFDAPDNRVIWVTPDGEEEWPLLPKREVASRLWDKIRGL